MTKDKWLGRIEDARKHIPSKLNLSSFSLKKVPEEVFETPLLTALDLSNNELTSLPERMVELRNLTQLNLGRNHFESFPEVITKLSKLESLVLELNEIRRLPESLDTLQNLTWLDVSSNSLNSFPESITNLRHLIWLDLSNNTIATLPPTIFKLQSLARLNLAGNPITHIHEAITRLKSLSGLYVDVDFLITPPPEVAAKGFSSIREYFRQLTIGQDYLYEAKLLILGEGGAGKTTLAQKIKEKGYELKDELTTQGIDVLQWSFPLDDARPFRVNIWDFGGQEIYHTTHQFFLTKRSLYILVADTRKEDTDFFYWLNVVELLSDNSPLIIVNNEKQNRHREINERHLRGQFENLKAVLATNLADNRGLDKVVDEIKHYVKNLPHVGSPLPQTWVYVRTELESDPRNYISLEEYLAICKDNGFAEAKDSLQLSRYLHDIGVFLHFQDDALLNKTVILKPSWATEAVYHVLDNQLVIRQLGRFNRSDLSAIWNMIEYKGMDNELLQLMMKFKLCYEMPDLPGTYIAPQLLTENQPIYGWQWDDNLLLRYTYEFMPKGILTQFIVTMNRFIATVNGQSLVWKSGIVLAKDQTAAEVIEHYGKREIHVKIAGKHKKELMTIIMHELDKIHSTYKRLKHDKLIPCNCMDCKDSNEPYFYRFERLQRFIEDKHDQIQCQQSYKMISVRGLIEDITIKPFDLVGKEKLANLSQISINIGENAYVGDIVLDSTIQSSFNKVSSADISVEMKEALTQLVNEVGLMSTSLDKDKAKELTSDLDTFVEEATKKLPRQKWYQLSAEGLMKAAEDIGKLGQPIIELVNRIVQLLVLAKTL